MRPKPLSKETRTPSVEGQKRGKSPSFSIFTSKGLSTRIRPISFKRPKVVIDPLLGVIDVEDVIPLMDVVPFQALGFKYQLGLSSFIFPAATHTRKQHSLGAYERTRRIAQNWLSYGFIEEEEARNLPIYALYHDIGHGPFSHTTEALSSIDHDERGIQIVQSLKETIEGAGFNYDMICNWFKKEHPLYLVVFDKNLGLEKLDYLERDAFYTLGESPGVEYLTHHIYFLNNQPVISEVAVDQAKDIQDFYIKMYKHVYMRKKTAALQRLIQKMTQELMRDGLGEEKLFELTDFGLLGRLETSENPLVKFYYQKFKKGAFPKVTLELKHEESVTHSEETSKLIKTMGLSDKVFKEIILSKKLSVDLGNSMFLDKIEKGIASLLGTPEHSIFILTQPKKRFEPDDIKVYTKQGTIGKTSDIYPGHFNAMREFGRSHLSLRIATFDKYRNEVYQQGEKVRDYLIDLFISTSSP